MTINELCEYDSYFTADKLAILQNDIGRSSFISTSTNPLMAGVWAIKEDTEPGKIYVVKVPEKDAYRIKSHFGLREFEYLIPDFVLPDEIMASFEYYDIKGILNYLKSQGLNITPDDLGVKHIKSTEAYKTCIKEYSKLIQNEISSITIPDSKLLYNIDIERLYDF